MQLSMSVVVLLTLLGSAWKARGMLDEIRGEIAALRAEQWTPAHEVEAWRLFVAINPDVDLRAPSIGDVIRNADAQARRSPTP